MNALLPALKNLKSMTSIDLLDEIENFNSRHCLSSPKFAEIDTGNNLWPNVLVDLLAVADIKSDLVEIHKFKLRTLVSRRNEIAHGRRNIVNEYAYYVEFESVVYDIMYKLAFLIDARLGSAPYI